MNRSPQPGPRENPSDSIRSMGKRPRAWAIYWGIWTLVALYMASMSLLEMRQGLTEESVLRILGLNLVQNYGWGLLSLLTLALVRKVPLHTRNSLRDWSIHAFASLIITTAGIFMMVSVIPLFFVPTYSFLPRFWRLTQQFFHFSYLIYYWGVVGVHECLQVFERYKEREKVAYKLEAKLAQAQLQALKMQLNPHFLFNTLNAVSALMHSDPDTANRMLLKLSDLLRLSLAQSSEQETSLSREIAFLEGYLEIEQLRFGERLKVKIEVPNSLLEAQVPTFVLQPLVENAIKHGLSERATGGTIHIRARIVGPRLYLEVEDDGPGASGAQRDLGNRPSRGPSSGIGIGTRNTKSRLQQLYGEEQSFDLDFPSSGGALARITLPLSLSKSSPILQGGLP